MEQIAQLNQSIVYREQSSEVAQYQQFVKKQLERTRKTYENMFMKWMNQWNDHLDQVILDIIQTSSSNQILPKLELVYTTIVNSESEVLKNIQNVRNILLQNSFGFERKVSDNNKHADKTVSNTNFFNETVTNFNNTTTNKFGRSTSNKGRSLSIGNGRRRLSKTNCFAEAKRVQVQNNYFSQTTNQTVFKTVTNDRIKKGKKKQQCGFKYLNKCLSSTSPSNFMLNVAKNNIQLVNKSRVKTPKKQQFCQKEIQEPEIKISINGKENQIQKQVQNHARRNSGTYQKMMENFEGKINQKIDQLMHKYTQIQQKLQRSESTNKKPPYIPEGRDSIKPNKQRNIQNISENISEIRSTVEQVKAIQRQPFKPKQNSQLTKQTKNTLQLTKKNPGKSEVKAIIPKNKIMRNKIEENTQQNDIQVVNFAKENSVRNSPSKFASKESSMLNSNQGITQQVSKFEKEQQILQKLIIEFYQSSSKFLLPVTKQLLYILRHKYNSYSNSHFLKINQTIQSFEVQKIHDEQRQMKEHLQKMQKLININCAADKKQKVLSYVNTFLRAYLSFRPDNCLDLSQRSNQSTEEMLQEALTLIKL